MLRPSEETVDTKPIFPKIPWLVYGFAEQQGGVEYGSRNYSRNQKLVVINWLSPLAIGINFNSFMVLPVVVVST